jgi:parvulin-like peptidyl-prolyl isomerase
MSIRRIRQTLHERSRLVAYIITAVFIVGLPLVFVPGSLFERQGQQVEGQSERDVIAHVDGEPLLRASLERQFSTMMTELASIYASVGQHVDLGRIWRYRLDAFDQAVMQELLLRQARERGISVSGGEVKKQVEQIVDQQVNQLKALFKGNEQDLQVRLAQILAAMGDRRRTKVDERYFRNWMTKHLSSSRRDDIEEQLTMQKLRQTVASAISATEEELKASYDRLRVREIEVAMRPRGAPERTEEEARKRAEELLARVKGGADFAEVAREESDSPETAEAGGLRESVALATTPPEWKEAVAPLQPGEISKPIRLPWGYVIVKVEERHPELPHEFEKNKERLLTEFVDQKRSEAWTLYQKKLQAEAKVEITDAEMLAYEQLREGKQEEALPHLERASQEAPKLSGAAAACIYYQLARILAAHNRWEEAVEAYALSGDSVLREELQLPGARAQALMGMARSYEHLEDTEQALLWYRAAGDASEVLLTHRELLGAYQRLGQEDLAQQEQEWIDSYEEAMRERDKMLEEQQRALEEQRPSPTPGPGPESGR